MGLSPTGLSLAQTCSLEPSSYPLALTWEQQSELLDVPQGDKLEMGHLGFAGTVALEPVGTAGHWKSGSRHGRIGPGGGQPHVGCPGHDGGSLEKYGQNMKVIRTTPLTNHVLCPFVISDSCVVFHSLSVAQVRF